MGSHTHSKSTSPTDFRYLKIRTHCLVTMSAVSWAVGRRLPDQRFEKVSVIVMDDLNWEEMRKLRDLSSKSRIVLV